MSQIFLILIVALVVFGPNKLPMLAYHLGKFARFLSYYKQKGLAFWQQQWMEQQLQENINKAKKADTHYQHSASKND